MMDVDAAPRQFCGHLIREDLHVARQHHEIGLGFSDQIPDRGLLRLPGFLRHRQIVERDLTEIETAVGLARMIGDDGGRDHLKFAGPRSEEHTSELQSLTNIVCRLLLAKKTRSLTLDVSGLRVGYRSSYND